MCGGSAEWIAPRFWIHGHFLRTEKRARNPRFAPVRLHFWSAFHFAMEALQAIQGTPIYASV